MIKELLFNYRQRRDYEKSKRIIPVKSDFYAALQITNGCNKQCKGCLRSANSTSYKISDEQFGLYLEDLKRLSPVCTFKYQFVTGGEPTIWKSGSMDIVDALAALSGLGLIELITMPTNGKNFEDLNYTREFFKRLSPGIDRKAVVGISISEYQENMSESGYIAMDNLLTVSREPGMKVIPVILVTMAVDDDIDERLKKIYPGVLQRVVALAPLGDAEGMDERCPSLSLYGSDKDSLGRFKPYFKREVVEKLGISANDFDEFPNSSVIDLLSLHTHCGDSPFVDDKWHFCLPFKDDPRFDLCEVGQMRSDTISGFLKDASIIRCIRTEGLLSAVNEHKEDLSLEKRESLDRMYSPESRLSVAYRGCMVCKRMHEDGIIQELMNGDNSSER